MIYEEITEDILNEKLITYGNRKPYGQIVFIAGGAGSGKGFAISNFLDSASFKIRDVDEMKKQLQVLNRLGKIDINTIIKKYGKSIKPKDIDLINKIQDDGFKLQNLNLKNPDHVYALHILVKAIGIKDASLEKLLLGKNNPETLPNILFDITAKDVTDITSVIPKLKAVGYQPNNIHLTWILTSYVTSLVNNNNRTRKVPDGSMGSENIMLKTHEGASNTIWGLVTKALPKGMNGRVDVILNNPQNTVFLKGADGKDIEKIQKNNQKEKKDIKVKFASGFLSLPLKKEKGGIFPEKVWRTKLFQWVKDNAPESITANMKESVITERQFKGLDGIDDKTPLTKISDTQKLKIIQSTGNIISFFVPKGFDRNFWQVISKGKIKKQKDLSNNVVYILPGKMIGSPKFKSIKDLIKGVDWKSVEKARRFNESVLTEAAYEDATRNELAQYIINLSIELKYAKANKDKKEIKFLEKDIAEVKAALAKKKNESIDEATFRPNSGTMSGGTYGLDNRKYELKRDVKGVQIGDYTNVILPKGTIIYNVPGGVFAHQDVLAAYQSGQNKYFNKPTLKGISIKRTKNTIMAIEKNSKILESVNESMFSMIDLIRQDSKDVRDFVKNVFKDREFKKMSNDKDFIKYLKSIYEGVVEEAQSPAQKAAFQKMLDKKAGKDESKEEEVNEISKFAGWVAIDHKGKRLEIKKSEAKDLYNAKLLAIKKLKVPKSKESMLVIKPGYNESVVNEANLRLNKKVKSELDAYLKGTKINSPEHQHAIMLILKGALTDANFHSEAKQLPKFFPKAKQSKHVGSAMEDVIEDKGAAYSKAAKWDGHDIIDAFSFYTSMTIGGSFGKKLETLKESISKSINESLKHNDMYTMLDIAAGYSSTQDQAAGQMWSDEQDLYDYLKSDHIPKKYHKKFHNDIKRRFKNIKESVVNEAKDNLYLQLHKKYAEQIKGLKAKKIKKLTDLISVQRWSKEDREDYFDMDSKKKKELGAEYTEERKLFKKYIGGDESVMLPRGTEKLSESAKAFIAIVNEATDIYQLKKIQITKFAGKSEEMVQINAPKYQTAGDHLVMTKKEFIHVLKMSPLLLKQLKESVNEGKKRFYQQDGIGRAKYTISYHDGKSKHKDGSDFYGIQIIKNKIELEKFRSELLKKGYREDSGFKKESVNEAYDGNWHDFKYEFPMRFDDITGNSPKAIKKISKKGKGYEVRTSTYMSQAEMGKVGLALGLKLKSFTKGGNINISIYEGVSEGKDDFTARHGKADINLKKGYKHHSEDELTKLYDKVGKLAKDKKIKKVDVIFEAKEDDVITQLRKIVKDKQNALVVDTKSKKKVRVDMQSANLMVQVYDALKQQSNKDKFVKSGIVAMGHMAFKLLKKESVNENDSYSITDDKGRHFLLIVGEEPKDSKGKSEYKKDGFYISPQKGFKGLITAYFKDEKTLKKNIDKKYHNQLGESVNEAKAGEIQIYHKSYTLAIEDAKRYAYLKGYTIADDEMFNKVGMNSKRPSVGKTTKVNLELLKNDKPQKKMLHIQVYGMKNSYELNAYIN